ncbi:unnamed protein product [Cyclocybe aegerita]|uniref:Endopeptidase S2P n=1 Tax=Cyclocybe aegerita TaxID=1973307 RepID=A0A8S0WHS7_CYCAE|nr:unnamed protein product [Cyclocybe aegerita]
MKYTLPAFCTRATMNPPHTGLVPHLHVPGHRPPPARLLLVHPPPRSPFPLPFLSLPLLPPPNHHQWPQHQPHLPLRALLLSLLLPPFLLPPKISLPLQNHPNPHPLPPPPIHHTVERSTRPAHLLPLSSLRPQPALAHLRQGGVRPRGGPRRAGDARCVCGGCVGVAWGRLGKGGLEAGVRAGDGGVGLTKRSLDDPLQPPATPHTGARSSTSWGQITPIIPGVTVPLSHLPLILLAVFLAQAFHELGHALAAALESLPLLSAGASLTLFLPSAFASFPSSLSSSLSSATSSPSPSTLPALSRARLIAAGPFHNILLWAFLLLLARSGLLPLLCGALSGYRDVAGVGRVVVSVAEVGLSPHFQSFILNFNCISSSKYVLTRLNTPDLTSLPAPPTRVDHHSVDDTPLGQPPSTHIDDTWTRYLLSTPHIHPSLGWCVGRHVLAKSDECCKPPFPHPNSPSNRTPSPYACFASLSTSLAPSPSPSELIQGCIDPVPILTSPHSNSKTNNRNRCSSTTDCPPESACVAPRVSAQLMRVSVRPPGAVWEVPLSGSGSGLAKDDGVGVGVEKEKEKEKEGEDAGEEEERRGREQERESVVLWSGPREEVWEEVQVTTWLPRASFLPLWVPLLVQLFWDYLLTATLSLYFFNLLPLPHLDGTQLLRAFLDIVLDPRFKEQGFVYDLESLESGAGHGSRDRDEYAGIRSRKRWKERVVKFANYGTGAVLGCFVVLNVMNGFG